MPMLGIMGIMFMMFEGTMFTAEMVTSHMLKKEEDK